MKTIPVDLVVIFLSSHLFIYNIYINAFITYIASTKKRFQKLKSKIVKIYFWSITKILSYFCHKYSCIIFKAAFLNLIILISKLIFLTIDCNAFFFILSIKQFFTDVFGMSFQMKQVSCSSIHR